LVDTFDSLVLFGGVMLLGFWIFVYNILRTMAPLGSYDITERHFLVSLGFFLVVTVLGFLLALDFSMPVFDGTRFLRTELVLTHATFAVFGAVMTTVYGALYQLGTMFTQTELHGIDTHLRPIEEVGHPTGVVLLAIGRLLNDVLLARIGGILVLAGALAFGTILARKLFEMQVEWNPMHTRYAIAVPGLLGWGLLSIPAWVRAPLAPIHLFGAAGSVHLLVLGAIGFVVFGTLYHIVPFIIWVHRYSDRLGFEDVPMIDDLYDDRLAALDGTLLVTGTLLLVATDLLSLPTLLEGAAGVLIGISVLAFATNMWLVVRDHSPYTVGQILLGSLYWESTGSGE
ncbi:MAG: hypothetical protein ABEJ27_05175, partial [Halodesulfurarchaeum sp.]